MPVGTRRSTMRSGLGTLEDRESDLYDEHLRELEKEGLIDGT
jgi:hypothetical protein